MNATNSIQYVTSVRMMWKGDGAMVVHRACDMGASEWQYAVCGSMRYKRLCLCVYVCATREWSACDREGENCVGFVAASNACSAWLLWFEWHTSLTCAQCNCVLWNILLLLE